MGKLPRKWLVTGNFTESGGVAYLRADGGFSPQVTEAKVFDDKAEAEAALQEAARAERVVSDPYLTEVGVGPQGLDTLTARERIREKGPSVRVRRPDPRVDGR